jgi:LysM repeat protein
MSFRRMLPFIFVNVIVSAAVVLLILAWWDGRQGGDAEPAATLAIATPTSSFAVQPAGGGAAGTPEAAVVEESGGPTTYVVQSGDTLLSISTQFDVSLDDIMAANELTNPDVLFVGQQLIIPIGGLATPTPPATATATVAVLPSPIPTEPLTQGEVDIQITQVVGAGQLTEEAVSISNLGSRPAALLNWRLIDAEGHIYTFGQVTLFGDGAAIVVHTESGQDGSSDLYWGQEQPVWQSGETVTLQDSEGTVQATYQVP